MDIDLTNPTGERLRAWREEADLDLDRAAVYISDRIAERISSEMLRRYEVGKVDERKMSALVLAGAVQLYGRRVSELPPATAKRVREVADLLKDLSACIAA